MTVFMLTQSIKLYTFHCHILNSTDFWTRWFMNPWLENELLLPLATFTAKFELIFVLTILTFNLVHEWLVGCFWSFLLFAQSIKFYTFHYYQYRCLKNVIHQIDSQNEWLLLSACFTAKFVLVFVLTLENAFS